MGAEWSILLGFLIYLIAIVFAIYYFYAYRKVYVLFFILAVSTYAFAVFYTWDVFELSRNFVMGLLSLSTVVMFGLGKYFSDLKLKPIKK